MLAINGSEGCMETRLTSEPQVRRTQRAIKQVLTERYYSWEDARKLAVNDPEVDLSGEGPAYTPSEDVFEDVDEVIAEEAHIEQVEAQVVQPKA